MKKENIIKFIIGVIIVCALAYFAIFGLNIGDKQIIKGAKNINTGLDISGGVSIVYQAKAEEGTVISDEDLEKSKTVISKRLEAKNIFDYIIRADSSSSQICVDIPADVNDKSKDPLEVVEGLDKTAKIMFKDPEGNILLQGDDIKNARYNEDPTDNTGLPSPHVVLEFSDEGTKKFADATEKLVGQAISIYLDDTEVAAPIVNSKIESNTAIITMGQGTYAEKKVQAEEYAMLISSGALPFSLDVVSKEYIGPYIGQQALEVSIEAGIVAFILIVLIMICVYRLPGIISSLALVAYLSIILLVLANTGISITLPGIAGLILSIGMAVDANVIIFERLKEELASNIGVKKAFERSFKNAMSAIIDGNVTTFLVALFLYIFGVGVIKGFGIVLVIGTLSSLFTAVIFTKFLLKEIIPVYNKSKFLFGIKKEKEAK